MKVTSDSEKIYYVNNNIGNDSFPGTVKQPIKSLRELNLRLKRESADICFAGGQIFDGTLILNGVMGKTINPIKIYSPGYEKAIIDGGNSEAIKIENCRNIWIKDLDIKGNGRKNGNITNGLSILVP